MWRRDQHLRSGRIETGGEQRGASANGRSRNVENQRMKEIRVAALVTEYFRPAHADVIITKILEGYDLDGQWTEARISIASMYLEQVFDHDIGLDLAYKHHVPIFGTVGEALAVGGTGVNVDGVILIGE